MALEEIEDSEEEFEEEEFEEEDEEDPEEEEEEEEEDEPVKPAPGERARIVLKPLKEKKNYFANVEKEGLEFFSSGCRLLDCVLGGGWVVGRMSNIIGDKSSGKTLLAIEACSNFHRQYPEGKIYYMEVESAFDKKYAAALGMPVDAIEFVDFGADKTVEFLHEFIDKISSPYVDKVENKKAKKEEKNYDPDYEPPVKKKRVKLEAVPALFIVDSLDAMSDREELNRDISTGTFAMNKQKKMSEFFRRLVTPLEKAKIHLMVISQVRDNIGVSFGDGLSRSGGRAMDFYASHALWLAEMGKIKSTKKGLTRSVGIKVRAQCKKNKVGLPYRECNYQVILGYGIDDIEASIAFLTSTKELASISDELGIDAEEADKLTVTMTKKLKKIMETKEGTARLRSILDRRVTEVWQQIETSFLPKVGKY